MTGIVTSIEGNQQSYCHITDSTGQVYFSHRNHFVEPAAMIVGTEVEFREGLAKTGPLPVALDVVVIQRKAA